MNTLNRTARLLAAVAATAVTAALFAGVVSLAEPQRSELIAKTAAQQSVAAAMRTVRVAAAR